MNIIISLIIVILLLFILYEYNKSQEKYTNQSIQPMLDEIIKEKTFWQDVEINLYKYHNKLVLLVAVGRGFDLMPEVYDLSGKYIGSPYGGITGHGDGQLPDWYKKAKFIKNLYKRGSNIVVNI